MVRPQPGQAVTLGVNERIPSDCRICCATLTSRSRPAPGSGVSVGEVLEYRNTVIRMIQTKEHHAQICKQELLILWSDYFKPEALSLFPDLHDTFWKAAKLCSYNKQHVDLAKSQELIDSVDKISEMFQKAEAAKKK